MLVTSNRLVLCSACRHREPSPPWSTCLAFPAGIPAWCLEGRANHRYPYPGDGGIRFEPDDDAPRAVLRQLEEFYP